MINITVPVYNRPSILLKTLPSIKCNTNIPHVLTVVDNGSDNETKRVLLELKKNNKIDNLIILDKNYGVACAVNVGWKLFPASFFMKLDSDMLIIKNKWLEDIFNIWRNGEDRSIIGPLWSKQINNRSKESIQSTYGTLYIAKNTLPGCATIIPDYVVQELGYWNEDYGIYGEEDADYCIRAHYGGFSMYAFSADDVINDLQKNINDGLSLSIKSKLRSQNIGNERKYGIYKINEYLYSMYIRKLNVPLKYEITSFDGIFAKLDISTDYVAFRKKLSSVQDKINRYLLSDMKLKLAQPDVVDKFTKLLGE